MITIKNRLNYTHIAIILLFTFVIVSCDQKPAKKLLIYNSIQNTVDEMNRYYIGKNLTDDVVFYKGENTSKNNRYEITFIYKWHNHEVPEIYYGQEDLNAGKKQAIESIRHIRKPSLDFLIENNLYFVYKYIDKNNNIVCQFVVKPDEYKQISKNTYPDYDDELAKQYKKTSSTKQKIQLLVDEINKNLPQRTSKYLTLNSVSNTSSFQKYEITYFYTYNDLKNNILFDEKQIKKTGINFIKTNPQLNFYKKNKVNFSFIYLDKDGTYIGKIEISDKDYSE
jgi:hypothetical protein